MSAGASFHVPGRLSLGTAVVLFVLLKWLLTDACGGCEDEARNDVEAVVEAKEDMILEVVVVVWS